MATPIKPLSERPVPAALNRLPRFIFTKRWPATREEAARKDVAFGIETRQQLLAEAARRFKKDD